MQFPPGCGRFQWMDVHGAGAQPSDPKAGDPAAFPHARGPLGDGIRISNYVRLVRDHAAGEIASGSLLGIDETKKLPAEGFTRPGPPLIRMNDSVRKKMDALFGE